MKIHFVRHGQTQYNKDGRITGQMDEPLTAEGMEQARTAAKDISQDYDAFYSSDLVRCRQTAEILNEQLKLEIKYDKRLRERDFGSIAGQSFKDVDPTGIIRQKDMDQEYDYRPYGGEAVEDVKKRLLEFIKELQDNSMAKKVIVVAHAGIIRLLHKLLNNQMQEKVHNSSIHEFEFPDK